MGLGLVLAALGIALLAAASLIPSPNVTAVRLNARATATLTKAECDNGKLVEVSFIWQGAAKDELMDSPDCSRIYAVGDEVVAYAASNDPSNLGPTSDWILHPDEHNPFDFIGPNGMPDFIRFLGLSATVAGLVVSYRALRQPAA